MNSIKLLKILEKKGIILSREGRRLNVQDPKGMLTKEIQQLLLVNKKTILNILPDTTEPAAIPLLLPQCIPNPVKLYEPFPFLDMQLGIYMGGEEFLEFHVYAHNYMENTVTDLDIERYQAAWNKTLQRHAHEINVVKADESLCVVMEPAPLHIKVLDLKLLAQEKVNTALKRVREQMKRSELPLDKWPWLDLRVSVWRENGKTLSRIHYNHNNFFMDIDSTTRLLQEVERYYQEPDLQLPALNLSFRDAVLALEKLAASAPGQLGRKYWEDRLTNLPGPPELPVRIGMNRRRRSRLQRRINRLSKLSWQNIKLHAKNHGLTPSSAIFAAYTEILSAWSNNRHFIIGNRVTRRLNIHPQIDDIFGNFSSLYPLEVDLRKGKTFVERAQHLHKQMMQDAHYLHWGGMQVIQSLKRMSDRMGVASIPFVASSGLSMENFKPAEFSCLETSQVMLDHQFWELHDGSYYFVWDVLEEFFPEGVINAMWNAYSQLLEYLASDSKVWNDEFFNLSPKAQLENRSKLATFKLPQKGLRLEDFLVNAAQQTPVANAFVGAGDVLSYDALHSGSDAIARKLYLSGVEVGDCVAVLATRTRVLLEAVFGVLKIGGVYIPIDYNLPEDHRNYILENSATKVLLIEPNTTAQLCRLSNVQVLKIKEQDNKICDLGTPRVDKQESDLAFVFYTSGSAAQASGVMLDHRAIVNTILDVNQRFNVNNNDVFLGVSSLNCDVSMYDIFGAVAAGATLVYPDPSQVMSPSHWLDLMLSNRVTVWNSTPSLLQILLEAAQLRETVLPDLRLVLLSGDWIALDLPDRIKAIAPNVNVVSLGGATEASIWSIYYPIDVVDPQWKSIPYGYPMLNQPWFILDEYGRSVPDWAVGDLYIGGIGLASGYWNEQEKTQASFVKHPQTGTRIYRTGHIGRYRPGGVIEFLGHRGLQVKIQGHDIELGEIEAVLASYPCISKAQVLVQTSAIKGQAKLAAYVVLAKASENIDVDSVKDYLAHKLPDYMIPRLFRVLESFPTTNNGEINTNALPFIMESQRQNNTVGQKRPKCKTEIELLSMWQTILPEREISITDEFSTIGGQSVEAIRLVGLIREILGAAISPGDIWRERTIEKLACFINTNTSKSNHYLLKIDENGSGIPLLLVHPTAGHVLYYGYLAKLLNRPVYAFQAPGINGCKRPLSSIDDFVDCYLAELAQLDWCGPVLIGGYSSGAPIAFELASRLQGSSWDVCGIVILDSPAPLIHGPVDDVTVFNWFVNDMDLVPEARQVIEQLNNRELSDSERLIKLSTFIQDQVFELPQIRNIYQVFKAMVRATRMYHAPNVGNDVLVLRASDGLVSEFAKHPFVDRGDWGWSEFTSGKVKSYSIPGNHYTILQEGQVERLAVAIEQWVATLIVNKRNEFNRVTANQLRSVVV